MGLPKYKIFKLVENVIGHRNKFQTVVDILARFLRGLVEKDRESIHLDHSEVFSACSVSTISDYIWWLQERWIKKSRKERV